MAFLFKNKKGSSNALPTASRDIRSSEGPAAPGSHIPTLNGLHQQQGNNSKPSSPTPNQQSSTGSLNAVSEKIPMRSPPDAAAEKTGHMGREHARGDSSEGRKGDGRVQPSPEQKTLVGRERSADAVCLSKPLMQVYAPLGELPESPGSLEELYGEKDVGEANKAFEQYQNRMTQQPQQLRQQSQDPSPYPWSQRKLAFTVSHTNPFPRYGAAVNSAASKDGAIYLMGGLINGSTVKGDLWMVETGQPGNQGSMSCYPVATTSEGPGPRVGHASLLVGNAFIVFGGDTKMDEGDMLDDTLYLLNTSTKQWSRALPAGPRPPGRYGHTLNILGSKLYIFGGQVEGYFFNDLVAFDLNALQASSNRWEILIQNTIDGGPPHGQIPPARTNHSMVAWGDKLYLFGGTDGVNWFNDVWSYSPQTNSWTMLECIGYIPSAREGHAAALVGDVMYIFGGRTEEGTDLGDLAAFRISSRRWYTFQNMGPSPSPRSGHSMTTVGKSIVVLAGEPSSAPRDVVELGMAYFLDTSKIRYPADSASNTPANERIQGTRRPSGEKSGLPVVGQGRAMPQQQRPQELMDRERTDSDDGRVRSPSESNGSSRLPRPGQTIPAPSGPPPQHQPPQPRPNGVPSSRQPTRPPGSDRAFSPTSDSERAQRFESNNAFANAAAQRGVGDNSSARNSPAMGREGGSRTQSPTYNRDGNRSIDEGVASPDQYQRRIKPETYTPTQENSESTLERKTSRSGQTPQPLNRENTMEALEESPRESEDAQPSQQQTQQPDRVRELQQSDRDEDLGPQDSGIGSSPALSQQNDELSKELESTKSRNAWYASELALAKRSGYQSRGGDSPAVDERTAEVFGDEARPMVEAVLKMRTEMGRLQQALDSQAQDSAQKLEQVQRERDAAVNEAMFHKSKGAGHGAGSSSDDGADEGRTSEMARRLATALAAHEELQRRIESLQAEMESERKSRAFAEETSDAAQKRVTELDQHRQQSSGELERLREELYEAQKEAREHAANHAEVKGQHELLRVERDELHGKHEAVVVEMGSHTSILDRLREALGSSEGKAAMFEQRLEEERGEKEGLESKLRQLKNEHEERVEELEATTKRLHEAEELGEKHAEEARTHRSAVLAGLGKISERGPDSSRAVDERVELLQQQIASAEQMVRTNQTAADAASEKLRRAEERIAGLEAYQEQASREGLSIRKQLQTALKDTHSLGAEKADLEQRLQQQQLEANAISVQHGALKDILAERGVNAAEVRKTRTLDSPSSQNRFSTPDLQRVKELEQQLEASLKSHDEMKAQFEAAGERDERLKRDYEEKLTALDSDHQAAVKYLRGTEKMLSKMKQELQRVKNENGELRKKIEKASSSARGTPDDWEAERSRLQKSLSETQDKLKTSVSDLEDRLQSLSTQLQGAQKELEQARQQHATSQADLSTLRATHNQSRGDLEKLQRDNNALEERARDAENKVQLLLDQVENSVDNYRRQSRGPSSNDNTTPASDRADDRQTTPTIPNGPPSNHTRGLSSASSTAMGPSRPLPKNSHTRNLSTGAESAYSSHTRTSSDGAASSVATADLLNNHNSQNGGFGGAGDGRNSMALDSLASELDALRSHWETQSQNLRLSGRFDFEDRGEGGLGLEDVSGGGGGGGDSDGGEGVSDVSKEPSRPSAGTAGLGTGQGGGGVVRQSAFGDLADWRSRLNVGEEENEGETSRPGTAEGPSGDKAGFATAAGEKSGAASGTAGATAAQGQQLQPKQQSMQGAF
ncbi:hypothetical protein MBLNU230_g6774t1 [Neophaeotheca triangularis]